MDVRKLPADVARCQAHNCTRREQCIRYLSPPQERQVYMHQPDPEVCTEFIQIADRHYVRGTSS